MTDRSSFIHRARYLHQVYLPRARDLLRDLNNDRDQAVAQCHNDGMTYQEIADEIGVSVPYVQVMVQRHNGSPSPSRRPKVRRQRIEVRA